MFADRSRAGKALAEKLSGYRGKKDVLILGIPRGGAVVAAQVSKILRLPLYVLVVRKISSPGNPELAIGAVGPDGSPHIDERLARLTNAIPEYVKIESEKQFLEVKRRMAEYGVKPINFKNKTAILVDDGIATGATMLAAIRILRERKVKKVVLAVPVCSADSARELGGLADEFISLETPEFFSAVGQFYSEFRQVTDDEVRRLLKSGQGAS
ncbi:MAG: phosphoribosyltransferase family protein [Candidatus Micrarchaeota archaeon]